MTATNDFAPDLPTSGEPTVDLMLAIQRHNANDRQIAFDLLDRTLEENKQLRAEVARLGRIVNLYTKAEYLRQQAFDIATYDEEEGPK